MLRLLIISFVFSLSVNTQAWDITNIQLEKDGKSITFNDSGKKGKKSRRAGKWVCTTKAFGKSFFGKGKSRGIATQKSVESCQSKYHGMHCEQTMCDNT